MVDLHKKIDLCLSGDQNEMKVMYDTMYSTIFKTCIRYAPNKTIAEDYIQECYLKIFDKLDMFIGDNMGDLGAWVKRITINYCIDQARKRKPSFCENTDIFEIRDFNDEDVDITKSYTLTQVLSAIHMLTPRYKTVFNMFVLDGFSHKEISEKLNLKPGSSKANLFKAKRKLREILLKYN